MGIDEALLLQQSGHIVLRTYLWARPSVSVGFRQDLPRSKDWPDHDIVRRWTGGGLVEHGKDDATYALIVPPDSTLALMRPRECYRLVHQALSSAVAGNKSVVLNNQSYGNAEICFQAPVPGDLLDESTGEKIAGAAQRRTKSGVLQQGSIQRPLDSKWGRIFAGNLAETVSPLSDSAIERVFRHGKNLACKRYTQKATD